VNFGKVDPILSAEKIPTNFEGMRTRSITKHMKGHVKAEPEETEDEEDEEEEEESKEKKQGKKKKTA